MIALLSEKEDAVSALLMRRQTSPERTPKVPSGTVLPTVVFVSCCLIPQVSVRE